MLVTSNEEDQRGFGKEMASEVGSIQIGGKGIPGRRGGQRHAGKKLWGNDEVILGELSLRCDEER